MSNTKVDLSVFEEVKTVGESSESLASIVYQMCEGDLDFISFVWTNGEDWRKVKAEFVSRFEYEHLDQNGGGEGGSEYCYGVFKLRGKIYKAEYSYYSYHGADYDDILNTLREVTPKEKTIIVYE